MTIKRFAGVLGALALGLGAMFALASPAQAQTVHFPANGWQAIDTGAGGARADSAHTAVVDATTAAVTWVSGEAASALGTSLETTDVGLPVETGDTISVEYALIGGADPAATAVRLFYYDTANADTWSVAPTAHAAAPDDGSTSGTLTITVGASGTVGTLGMVYDTSNGGVAGTVQFTNLKVNDTTILFVKPEPPANSCDEYGNPDWCNPEAEDYDCEGGDGDGPEFVEGPVDPVGEDPFELDGNGDGVGCEAEETDEGDQTDDTETVGNANGGDKGEQLPLTGAGYLPWIGIGGAAAIVLGSLGLLLLRRRKPVRFTA